MFEVFSKLNELLNSFLLNLGIYGPILACFLIMFESIVPILPLFVFITINFIYFGPILGFILSWLFTVLGCILSFFLFRKKMRHWFSKKIEKHSKFQKMMKNINHLKCEQLTTLIAIPATPAFLVNVCAGLSKITFKKFLVSLSIGKIFLVLFWGIVGTSMIEALTHPIALIKVLILIVSSYICSKIVSKKLNIE
ncbi:MAG: TVP38/TMEM64 family protein [Bacilli bacterium]|nr:TVP38/TMEM64 family protein [Bacilli bacterium]